MRVSVVVPTYNRGPALGQTLARLMASALAETDDLAPPFGGDATAIIAASETMRPPSRIRRPSGYP